MASLELDNSTIVKNLALATEYFKAYYKVAYEKDLYSGGANGFIPFNIEFTLDGISGIKIYDKLVVDTSFLPHKYTKTLDFIVTGISNTLKDGDWETVIKTTLIPKLSKTDVKINAANFQFVKYTPEAPTFNGTNLPLTTSGGTFIQNLVKILEDERKLWLPNYTETNPPIGHGDYTPEQATMWSGRFISWAIQTAGKDIWSPTIPKFSSYQRHSGYVNQAKINREGNKGYFKAYKYDETPVQLGDLLAYSHDGGTWDTNGTNTSFTGHGDICTKIESGYAWCIGGNLTHTVKYAKYKVTPTNYLQVGGSGGKPSDFYTGQNRPKGSPNTDVFQAILRFTLP